MGKASRWLRGLLTFKKQPSNHHQQQQHQQQQQQTTVNEKSRWSFVKSSNKHKRRESRDGGDVTEVIDPDKHAIAVAAATAAVAEAAVAAAKAAAAVVKLTSSSGRCDSSSYYGYRRCGGGTRQRWAAVVIQSAFRGYLARRALRALKALVRLQALVRGHIARKQTAEQVRQMQALLRVQARARAGRALRSESSQSSSRSSHHHTPVSSISIILDPQTPEKSEEVRSRSPRRNQPSPLKKNTSKAESRGTIGQVRPIRGTNRVNTHGINDRVWDPLMQSYPLNDQPIDKILEVDPGKPYTTPKQKNSYEPLPLTPLNIACEVDDASFCTAENSPQPFSASSVGCGSSRRGPFTPNKSGSFHRYLSGYSDYPNYMCYTESSKAKLRSMSAPKQRPHYERTSSTKRQSYHAVSDSKSGSEMLSTSYSSFTSKAYPGSGRLDKLGMPAMRGDSYSYASSYGHI